MASVNALAVGEQVDIGALLQITQNTAMSTNALSQQMGLIAHQVNENAQEIVVLKERMTTHERTVTLTNYQAKEMFNAVQSVVRERVGYPSPYFGAFCRKCWSDAKKHSKVAQTYQFTLQVDFDECMGYIGSWYPEGYSGVDAYKAHLGSLHCDG